MSFPQNYPNSPPSIRFTSDVWHPNGLLLSQSHPLHINCTHTMENNLFFYIAVYPDGRVCISILHPPGDDPNGYELASERWTPVHTVCNSCKLPLFLC